MVSVGALAFRAAERLRRSRSQQLLRQMEPLTRLSPEEARALQQERLSNLLAHSESRVPYYRELFRSLGVTSRDIRSLEDFARLPVLTKEIIRERGRDLVRDDVDIASLSVHHSGGSTGVPLTFYRDAAYMDASAAGTLRNLGQAGWRPGEMIAFFWGWNDRLNHMPRWEFELRQWLRRMYQFDPFQSGPDDMDRWIRRWRWLKPSVAHGYASTMARFAAHVEARGERLSSLKGVFTTAEKLYPEQREVLSRVFSCPVFDCYGSSEVQNIATECAHGRMHVNGDFVVLELDRNGPAEGRGAAPFLLTSLWNYSMPFIRYRNEDCGSLVAGSCDCGNGFPLMDLRVARTSDNFPLPNGRVVHGEFFTHLMYGSEGIASFQFHQTDPGKIVLYVVAGPGMPEARERAVASAAEQIQALAPGLLVVETRMVDSIPLSKAGKHRFTRSDVTAASLRVGVG